MEEHLSILGIVWKKFLKDDNYWGDGSVEGDIIKKNDNDIDEYNDLLDYDNIKDNDNINIYCGLVFKENKEIELKDFFKEWFDKNVLKNSYFNVKVENGFDEEFIEYIKNFDGAEIIY
jgi:hypothetical protein